MKRLFSVLAAGAVSVLAEEVVIQSYGPPGHLQFNEVTNAREYRVEWASAPEGPWTNSWYSLAAIPANRTGIVSCTVPMLYRVVARVGPLETMVLIPAGDFVMGATTNMGHESLYQETPQHSVSVSAFLMDQYEVTKDLWDYVASWAQTNGYDITPGLNSAKAPDHPVVFVQWHEATRWCNARSEKEGFTPCYTVSGSVYRMGSSNPSCNWAADGYRLPTEAEWEKAARGGVPNFRFPWNDSNTIQHARANYNSSATFPYDTSPTRGYHPTYTTGATPYTSPVGSFAPNAYGLYDMAGNADEWCWDWWDQSYYQHSEATDPRGPTNGLARVHRGGSWVQMTEYARVAYRNSDSPGSAGSHSGFRCVRSP